MLFTPGFDFSDSANPGRMIGEAAYDGWLEFGKIISQLSESHSIRLKVLYDAPSSMGERRVDGWMERLLPEVTARGIVELARAVGGL